MADIIHDQILAELRPVYEGRDSGKSELFTNAMSRALRARAVEARTRSNRFESDELIKGRLVEVLRLDSKRSRGPMLVEGCQDHTEGEIDID